MRKESSLLIIKLLSGLALIGSIAWLIAAPDYEPAIAVVTSLAALIAVFAPRKKENPRASQSQIVSDGGIGIQAGGNISTGDIGAIKRAKDAE